MVKNSKFTNLFVVAVTEFLMMYLSLKIKKIPLNMCREFCDSAAVINLIRLGLFIIPIIICLIYMKLTYPDKLKIFTAGGPVVSAKALGIGTAIGFVMNFTLCILSLISGSVKYSFLGFNPLLLVAVVCCFIQCSAEEVLIRGYASSYLEDKYPCDVVAFVGGVLFVLHHIGNLKKCGFSAVFCLNVFLIGIILYLLVKLTKSIWVAYGLHTAWNYTQSFIFGSENSGIESTLAFFSSSDKKDSFFCDTVYGNEGTWMCTIVCAVVILILFRMLQKRNVQQ